MSVGQKTISSLKALAAARLMGQVLNWAATLIVIRLLAPEDYGLMALAVLFATAASMVSELGVADALLQREELDDDTLQRALGFLLVLACSIFALLYFVSPMAAEFFDAPRLENVLAVLALQFPLTAIGTIGDVLLRRNLAYQKKGKVEFFAMLAGSALTLALAIYGLGVWALVWGNIAMISARSAGFILASRWFLLPRFRFENVGSFLVFGGHVTIGRLLWTSYNQAPAFIIGKWLGQNALGVYAIAMQIASLPMQKISAIINDVGLAALSRLQNEPKEFERQFLRANALNAVIAFPVFFGISAVAPELVTVILAETWEPAIAPLQVLALTLPLRMLATLLPTALHAVGETRISLHLRAVTAVLMIASFFIGMRENGMMGVAYAWLFIFPLAFLINCLMSLPRLQISLQGYWQCFWPSAASAAFMWFSVAGSRPWLSEFEMPLWLQLGALIMIGVVSFSLATLLLNRHMFGELKRFIRPG